MPFDKLKAASIVERLTAPSLSRGLSKDWIFCVPFRRVAAPPCRRIAPFSTEQRGILWNPAKYVRALFRRKPVAPLSPERYNLALCRFVAVHFMIEN